MNRSCATLALALLTGCAAFDLTEAECRGTNWYERGYDDGYFGHPQQFLRLQQQCRRFGVEVAEAEYFKGWEGGHDEWYRLMGSMGMRR